MRLCLQALATLSQAQINNLVAFLLSKDRISDSLSSLGDK
jgi:hypothetical protein